MGALVGIFMAGLMLPIAFMLFILFIPFFVAMAPFAFLAYLIFKAIVG
jgi:hypothetical protein